MRCSVLALTAAFLTTFLVEPINAQNDPPKITERPRNQAVRAGVIAAFFCEARGDPLPTIAWRKNGKKVSSTQSRYLVQEYPGGGSMLRIDPVRSGRDDATYECVAENGVGDAVSAEATLNVYENDKLPLGFPQITQQPTTKVIEMGHTAVLICAATGKPIPGIRWVKDLLPVQIGKNPRYTILNNSQMPGALQITNTVEDDLGRYECVAENDVGTEYSQSTMLYVKGRHSSRISRVPIVQVQMS